MKKNLLARMIFVALLFLAFVICAESLHAACIASRYPHEGNLWIQGWPLSIMWDYDPSGNPGNAVKIELLKGVSTHTVISPNADIQSPSYGSFTGQFTWPVPLALDNGNDYKIRVTSLTNPACTSTVAISIYNKIKAVTSPSQGQEWKRGTNHTITWTFEGSTTNQDVVELWLYKSETGKKDAIARNIPVTAGSYNWTVGNLEGRRRADPGTGYFIEVFFKDNVHAGRSGIFTIKDLLIDPKDIKTPIEKNINPVIPRAR